VSVVDGERLRGCSGDTLLVWKSGGTDPGGGGIVCISVVIVVVVSVVIFVIVVCLCGVPD
jgi:hypothetical protein